MKYDGYLALIDGQLGDAVETANVRSPAMGEVIARVPECSARDADSALKAARRAQREWGRLAPVERAAIMRRAADLIDRDSENLVDIVVDEQGKPVVKARGEVDGAAEFFRYFAEFARRI